MKIERHGESAVLTSLRREWEDLLSRAEGTSFFQTPQWNALWWSYFGQGRELSLLTLRDEEGGLRGLAPLCIEEGPGGRGVLRFIGGMELSDSLDFVVERGVEGDFYRGLFGYLSERAKGLGLDLHFLPEDSTFLGTGNPLFEETALQWEIRSEEVSPVLPLPSQWEDYLGGLRQKDRHELQRKTRRAHAGGQIRIWKTSRVEDLGRDVGMFVELHRKSKETKRGFMDERNEAFFHDLAGVLFSMGRLALYFLSLNGQPAASLFGIRYGEGLALYNSGFDPEFSPLSPGIVLIGRAIQETIEEGGRWFDFLRGPEPYKYRFGARERWLYNVQIWA